MTRAFNVGGVDLVDIVKRSTVRLTQRGYSGVQTLSFDVQLYRRPSTVLANEMVVEYVEGGATEFEGLLRVLTEWELPGDLLMASVTAQDYTVLAADDVIPAGVVRTTQETDKQRLTWLFSTYGTKGITVGGNAQQLLASFPLDSGGAASQDFGGKTLAEAVQDICRISGGQWYVDANKDLHYFEAESGTAPWLLSDQPNETTSFGYTGLMLPTDTVTVKNKLLVIGTGYSDTFHELDSQDAYGVHGTTLRDSSVDTASRGLQVATAYFAQNAWPRQDGQVIVYKAGLRPGMLLDIEHSGRNIGAPLQYRDAVLRAGSLGLYLRLGEPSGTLRDSSGNGNDATPFNSPTYGVAGALAKDPNKALTFASASLEYLSVADHASIDFADVVTFCAWVKRSSAALHGLLSKGTNSLEVRWDASNKIVVRKAGVGTIKTSSTSCPSDGQWHHVAVVKNAGTTTIYVDGADAGGTTTNQTLANTSSALVIARDATPTYYNGSLDEVIVATAAWSATTIANLYKYGKGQRASFQIVQVDMGLEETRPVYTLRIGSRPVTLGSLFASAAAGITGATTLAEEALEGDSVAPSTPGSLTLDSSVVVGDDGSAMVALDASWTPNAELDFAYYELQAEEALRGTVAFVASGSGTGGSLPAGEYSVIVTGVPLVEGVESGETIASVPQTVVLSAGQRLYVNVTAKAGCTRYRVYASRDVDPLYSFYTTTTGSDVEVTTEGTGGTAPQVSTAVAFIAPMTRTTGSPSTRWAPVAGNVTHGVRIRALDSWANASAWSGVSTIVTDRDATAPAIPSGLTAVGGYRLLGITWQRVAERDVDRYEVRWAPEDSGNPGNPDTTAWTSATVRASLATVSELAPDILYFVQVRAIDRSDNVVTSYLDDTPVDANTNPEAGWSNDGTNEPWVSATPTLIGTADVAFNSVVTQLLTAGTIDAGAITTGTLTVTGQVGGGAPDLFVVLDAEGDEILRIDQYGIVARDPVDPSIAMRLKSGVLEFTAEYNESDPDSSPWTTGISAYGIVADRITSGRLPGGHNSIPNSGFELSAYSTTFSTVWTSQAEFAGWVSGTDINVTADAAGTLKVS